MRNFAKSNTRSIDGKQQKNIYDIQRFVYYPNNIEGGR